jgi:parallel beta-helix repeat protein
MELPVKATRATKMLGFDADGDPVMSGSTMTDIDASVAAAFAGGVLASSYQFTGTGSQVAFTITGGVTDILNSSAIIVDIDGVTQHTDTYTVSGKVVTFSVAPPLNGDIQVRYNAYLGTATDASGITYNQGGTGASSRTVENKLQESVSVKDFGAVGDGVTDDTAAIQAAFNTGKDVLFTDGTFLCSMITVTTPDISITSHNATIKHNTATTLQGSRTWKTWTEDDTGTEVTTGVDYTFYITGDNVSLTGLTIDGNAIAYAASAGHPNTEVHIVWFDGVSRGTVLNTKITNFNGNAIYVYDSDNVVIDKCTVLNSPGLTGSIVSQDQIAIHSSEQCTVSNCEVGGFSAWSAIGTVGGKRAVTTGAELGGFLPYNSNLTGVYNGFTSMGRAIGASYASHNIVNNIAKSDVVDATESGGGGVLGRVITINSGGCLVSGNTIYDTTDLSQGGLGLGHDYTTTANELISAVRSSDSIVKDNQVFGFTKSGQGYGLITGGAYNMIIENNTIYDCNMGIYHGRYSTSNFIKSNTFQHTGTAISITPSEPNADAVGIPVLNIENNIFSANDIAIDGRTLGSGYSDYYISGNMIQSTHTTNKTIDINHGRLFFDNNKIQSTTDDSTLYFYAYGSIEPDIDITNNTLLMGGAAGIAVYLEASYATYRGRIAFTDNSLYSSTNEKYVRIRRQTRNLDVFGNRFTNSMISMDSALLGMSIKSNTFESSVQASIVYDGTNGTETICDISDNVFKQTDYSSPIKCNTVYDSMHKITNNIVNQDKPIVNSSRIQNTYNYCTVTGNIKIASSVMTSADT